MLLVEKKSQIVSLAVTFLLLLCGLAAAQDRIVDLHFKQPPVSKSDTATTLQSLVKVQGTGGVCQDGLYLISHFGDREDLFEKENQKAIDSPMIHETWRFCSLFSARGEGGVLMGRNWDNQNVGSIIINLYRPPGGYASISFSRAIDMGLPLNMDLEQLSKSELGNKLLLAPFYAMDGINEHGLVVSVAGVRQTALRQRDDRRLVFVTFLIRMILDQAKDVEEALDLAEKFIPFDLDKNSLNAHFFVVDSSGRSAILEYDENQWRKIYPEESWQVLTNKPVFNVPDSGLRGQCWRYRSISETLEKANGDVDWATGMKILQDVAQEGTTWSVVYSPTAGELRFSVYQNWDRVYRLTMP